MGFLGAISERLGDLAMGPRNPCAKVGCIACCGDNFFQGPDRLEFSTLTHKATHIVEVTRNELEERRDALRERVAKGEKANETTVYVHRDESNPKARLRRAVLIDGPCPQLTFNDAIGVFECGAGEGRPKQCRGLPFGGRECNNLQVVKNKGQVFLGAIGKRPGL